MNFERNISIMLVILSFAAVFSGFKLFLTPSESKGSDTLPRFQIPAAQDGIGVIKIYGPISFESDSGLGINPSGADYVVKKIREMTKNNRVKAIVLRINSPGGTVGSAQEICAEIGRAKEKGKKIVVSMGDIAASGGYYIASQADLILANPGTLTGSIGVIMDMMNFEEMFKKIGVSSHVIKSGEFKDIGSWSRSMTQREKDLLQALIDNAYNQFVNAVAEGRKMQVEEVKKYADGRIFSGEQALEYGFIDQLGGYQDALSAAAKLAGLPEPAHIIDSKSKFEEIFEMLEMNSKIFLKSQNPFEILKGAQNELKI